MNKNKIDSLVLLFCLSFLLFFTVSCGSKNEKGHPLFIKAKHSENNGEYKKAVECYEKYLRVNPASAVTHYALAELYNDNIDDPFYAVYHFKEFLKLKPNSPDRDSIQSWIDAAEKKMADRILERDPESVSKEEVMKLKEYNEKYRNYLLKLKSRNAALRAKLNAPSSPDNKEVSSNTSSEQPKLLATKDSHILFDSDGSAVILRTYIVKAGDSLSKISREVYGSSKYYKVIFEANRATMKTEASLKIGQELKIPKLQKK